MQYISEKMNVQNELQEKQNLAQHVAPQKSFLKIDNYCFSCKQPGELSQCSNCPKRYHKTCFGDSLNSQIQISDKIICHSCRPNSSCVECHKQLRKKLFLNRLKFPYKLICTVCKQRVHLSCYAQKEKIEVSLFSPNQHNTHLYVCKKCLMVCGIHIFIQKKITTQKAFWKVSPFYNSSVHTSWLEESICQKILEQQSKRIHNNTALNFKEKLYEQRCQVNKILKINIPLKFMGLKLEQIVNIVLNVSRKVQYGSPTNFKFLIKWRTLQTEESTWEDEYLVKKIALDLLEDYFKYALHARGKITTEKLRDHMTFKYRCPPIQLPLDTEENFIKNGYHLITNKQQHETDLQLIGLISRFYMHKPNQKPVLIITEIPDKWHEQFELFAPHFRSAQLKGSQNNLLCQIKNELFQKDKPMFDVLVTDYISFMKAFIQIMISDYSIIVLDCEARYNKLDGEFWKKFEKPYKVIKAEKMSDKIQKMVSMFKAMSEKRLQQKVAQPKLTKVNQIKIHNPKRKEDDFVVEESSTRKEFYPCERMCFLRYILSFGLNNEEPDKILKQLIIFQGPDRMFEDDEHHLRRLKRHIKQFLITLEDSSEPTNKKYFQCFNKSQIRQRICGLMIFKNVYYYYRMRQGKFPMTCRFHIAYNEKRGKSEEIYSHNWKTKDDIELMRLVLKHGYGRWSEICEDFQKDNSVIFFKGYKYLIQALYPDFQKTDNFMTNIEAIVELRTNLILNYKVFESLPMEKEQSR